MKKKLPAHAGEHAPDFFSPHVREARRFYLDLNPPKAAPLAVVCGGYEHCRQDYAIHRTSFPYYSIEYVARGEGTVKLQGRAQTLQPGRLFAYGPGIRQDISSAPANPLVKYFVDFAGREALSLLRSCHLAPGRVTQVFPPNEVQGLFEELIRAGVRGGSRSGELCARLLECLAMKIEEARAPLGGAETLAFATYHQCRQYLEQHFERLRTLQQISKECHVDGSYLCRLFRRYDHQTPYQFLLRLKMNRAAEQLQEPGALVKQVAEAAGFNDPSHFSRAFKSVLGLAPDAFRRFR